MTDTIRRPPRSRLRWGGTVLVVALTRCGGDEPAPAVAPSGSSPSSSAGPSADPSVDPSAVQSAAPTRTEFTSLDEPLSRPVPGDTAAAKEVLLQYVAMIQAHSYDDAAHALDYALELDPANPNALLQQGFLLCDFTPVRDPGKAVRAFRLAQLVIPGNALAAAGEGISRAFCGDFAAAEPLLRAALGQQPPLPDSALGLVRLALAQGARQRADDTAADTYFLAAAQTPGTSLGARVEALRERGILAIERDDLEQASQCFAQVLALNPVDVGTHYQLSRLARKQGQTELAARYARIYETLRQLEDHQSGRFADNADLRIYLRRQLVEAYPEYGRARPLLIRELIDVGHTAEARTEIAALEPTVTSDAARAELLFLEARAAARDGNIAEAERLRPEILRLDPKLPLELLRQILRDWRKSSPEVTEEACQEKFDEWTGG